ncbi:hypothetical protein ADIS_0544 [Lunatimonas lonarensis]|uniref:Uncharacterized protein n=1 Tax=Lunatimonas lonarensis TaxID=1232681 RepID=R7ZXS0_9BACT|nr:hypothetical protein ADIS_0544 [Lunatimonas lonarensis]
MYPVWDKGFEHFMHPLIHTRKATPKTFVLEDVAPLIPIGTRIRIPSYHMEWE